MRSASLCRIPRRDISSGKQLLMTGLASKRRALLAGRGRRRHILRPFGSLVEHYYRVPHIFQAAVHALAQSFGWVMSSGSMEMLRIPARAANDERVFARPMTPSLA